MKEKQPMRRSRWPVATVVAGALVLLAPMVGQAAGAPALAFTPSTNGSFDYGTVAPGQTASQTFTLRNTGGSGSGGLTVALAGSGAFTKTSDACTGAALGPGKSCGVTVRYAPNVAGQSDAATLTATGTRPAVRASITLTGAGTPANDVAPTVQSASPADGADHVAVNTNVTVNLSEPVTATTNSFSIECPSGSASESFTVSGSGTSSVTLDPTSDLPAGTLCTVKVIANQISDVDAVDPPDHMTANYQFSFATDSAPFVTATTPADGTSNVAANAHIEVDFSEPVTVDSSSFTISCDGNPQTFGLSGSGTSSITLDPDSDLPTANCTVTAVAANISDSDTGDPPDHPAANHALSFTTQDAAPSVTTTSPADGAIHVAANANIVVNFSEPVTATGSSFTLECPAGTPQSFTVSGSPGSSITLDPTSNLPDGMICSVTVVANQISDVDTADPPDQMAADYPFSFTTDTAPTSGHIYWATGNGSEIGRADLDGQNVDHSFIAGQLATWGVAVDASHVYWTSLAGTIGRADLDGGNPNSSFITGASDIRGVAVDSSYIYWTNSGANAIGRADLDGNNANQTFITGASFPTGVAVDSGHIYWTNWTNGTIGRADLDGGNATQNFIGGGQHPFGVALDSRYIYWTNYELGTIGRADLDGLNPTQSFITGPFGAAGVAVDSGHIYWTNSPNSIGRADLDGQNPNPSFITGTSGAFALAVDSGGGTPVPCCVYWTDNATDSLGRADLDGQNANQTFITGAASPFGIAVGGEHIYWANAHTSTIGRADLDGQNVNQSIISGVSYPQGVAIDSGHVYWVDYDTGSIGRADPDGQNANQSFITGASGPSGIAVDSGHVYWTNYNSGTIGRADLDGQNANQSFITGASGPSGIAVDSGHIYWANYGSDTIGRADLNGQNASQAFVVGASLPLGVAVGCSHVYWANSNSGTIGRADLDGQNASQAFIVGASVPLGVAVGCG